MTQQEAEKLMKENTGIIGKRAKLPDWEEIKQIFSITSFKGTHSQDNSWDILVIFGPIDGFDFKAAVLKNVLPFIIH